MDSKQVPIFYINRDGDEQRRQHIKKVLTNCQLKGTRFRAITPDALPTIEFEPPVIHRSITDIACLSSHLLLIKALHLHNDHWPVLILEDDCVLPDFLDLEQLINSAPQGWEALQLATSTSQHLMQLYKYWTDCQLKWHGWHPEHYGCFAYLITKSGARKVVDRYFPVNHVVIKGVHMPRFNVADYLIYNEVRSYTSCFPLAYNFDFESTLGDTIWRPSRQLCESLCQAIWSHARIPEHLIDAAHQIRKDNYWN